MTGNRKRVTWVSCLFLLFTTQGIAANYETIATVDAYIGEYDVRVDICCHNETGLLEYFNLIVFDDTKLEFASIEADRGNLWYGLYPTHVDGNRIYVHGVASAPSYCIGPDGGDPGSPLYHVNFNVKPGVEAGLAGISFSSEPIWDGHWNDCSGYAVSPPPEYYGGGINVLGHAGTLTIGDDSTSAGQQAVADVYMHNDLDVFEYFNQILFEDVVADVDSIVAVRGVLHYGNYPTHVSGDTIFVHGWAGNGGCFHADHTYPGAALYRVYFSLHETAPPGYTMLLTYLEGSPIWNHWVGCDLNTTDAFEATGGSIYVQNPTGAPADGPVAVEARLGPVVPNPTARGAVISYYLAAPGHVTLDVYDSRGRRVRTMESGRRGGGWHSANWDGTDDGGGRSPAACISCVFAPGLRPCAGNSRWSDKIHTGESPRPFEICSARRPVSRIAVRKTTFSLPSWPCMCSLTCESGSDVPV